MEGCSLRELGYSIHLSVVIVGAGGWRQARTQDRATRSYIQQLRHESFNRATKLGRCDPFLHPSRNI